MNGPAGSTLSRVSIGRTRMRRMSRINWNGPCFVLRLKDCSTHNPTTKTWQPNSWRVSPHMKTLTLEPRNGSPSAGKNRQNRFVSNGCASFTVSVATLLTGDLKLDSLSSGNHWNILRLLQLLSLLWRSDYWPAPGNTQSETMMPLKSTHLST